MGIITGPALVELLHDAIPHASHTMSDPVIYEKYDEVRFVWRRVAYRVSYNLGVEQVEGRTIIANSTTLLMQDLLRLYYSELTEPTMEELNQANDTEEMHRG